MAALPARNWQLRYRSHCGVRDQFTGNRHCAWRGSELRRVFLQCLMEWATFDRNRCKLNSSGSVDGI